MKQFKHYPPAGPRLYVGFATEGKEKGISYQRRLLIRVFLQEDEHQVLQHSTGS